MHLDEMAELAESLKILEDSPDGSAMAQLAVMSVALELFKERNDGKYHDLWKIYGASDSLHHMKSKYLRTRQNFEDVMESDAGAMDIDDALDLINYTCFYIRNMLAGRFASPTTEDL